VNLQHGIYAICLLAALASDFALADESIFDGALKIERPKIANIISLKSTSIYFATNRKISEETIEISSRNYENGYNLSLIDYNKIFSNEVGADIAIGQALVDFPAERQLADQTYSPGSYADNPLKNFSLVSVAFTGESGIWRDNVIGTKGESFGKDVLVYVHGFVTTFSTAASEAAQLKNDLDFGGPIVLFSWPSDIGYFNYSEAIRREKISSDYLSAVFNVLMQLGKTGKDSNPLPKEELIAHSLGASLALDTLFSLHNIWHSMGVKLNTLILAAADVNLTKFSFRDLPIINDYAYKTDLLCSDSDRALLLAQYMNPEDPPGQRLGRCFSESSSFRRPELDIYHFNGPLKDYEGHSYYLYDVNTLGNIKDQIANPLKR